MKNKVVYDDYEIFRNLDGEYAITFITIGENGEKIGTKPELFYDKNGTPKQKFVDEAIKIREAAILNEKLKEAKRSRKRVEMPEDVKVGKVNDGWFDTFVGKYGHVAAITTTAIGSGVLIALGLGADVKANANTDKAAMPKDSDKVAEDTAVPSTKKADSKANDETKSPLDNENLEKRVVVSLEDYVNVVNDVDKELNEKRELNVSMESIQATVFVANAKYMSAEDTKKLIDAGIISQDPEDVWKATLPVTRTLTSNNSRTVNGETPISGSLFCVNPRAKEVCDAFTSISVENAKAYEIVTKYEGRKKLKEDEKKELDEAVATITKNWDTMMLYDKIERVDENSGLVVNGKVYTFDNTPEEAHWLSITGGGFFAAQAVAYTKTCGLHEDRTSKEIQAAVDFASHVGKNSSEVNTNYAAMKNIVIINLGKACELGEDVNTIGNEEARVVIGEDGNIDLSYDDQVYSLGRRKM